MKWVIVVAVILLYVHLFNAIASLYFDSGYTMSWRDLYRRFMPPVKVTVEL